MVNGKPTDHRETQTAPARQSKRRTNAPSGAAVDPGTAAPEFDPTRWAGQVSRHIDIADWAASLSAVLEVPEIWTGASTTTAPDPETQRATITQLRENTPLYELTAALIAPWVIEAFMPTLPQADRIGANLVALMRYLFDAPGIVDYDPWQGLFDWIWSHQSAWAGAAIRRQLGTESIRELSPEEYHRRRAEYLRRADAQVLRERSDQLLSTYAQELAKVVVDAMDIGQATPDRMALITGQLPVQDVAHLLGTIGPVAMSSDALQSPMVDGYLPVMSSAHYQAVREALYLNTFQRHEDSPWPTARLAAGPTGGQAQLRPPGVDGQFVPADQIDGWAALMWRQRDKLSDLDADALDAMSALWLSQARSAQDRAIGDVDGLLTMRGIQPRARSEGQRSGFRKEQRHEMQQALAHIQNLWLDIADIEDESGVRRGLQSRAFVITDRYGVTDRSGTMVDMERFIFQPGRVFAQFLIGAGQQSALLSAKALKYDPYRQTWEKRLARFLSWQWRLHDSGAKAQPYDIGTLLDACGVTINPRFPYRTRDRLEQALDTLQRDEIIAAWHYQDWDEALTEQRGWRDLWRATTLHIAPPAAVVAYYAALNPPAIAPSLESLPDLPVTSASPTEIGRLIKARRRKLKQSQKAIATVLGVTQSYISKLEGGTLENTQPSDAFRIRFEHWLIEDE